MSGKLAPGERLRDGDLAQWLGVSRTPVREAWPGSSTPAGAHAAVPQTWSARSTPARRSRRTVVAAMHELAVREAVPQLTAADLDAMRAANARFAAAIDADDVDAAVAADDDFHGVPVRARANHSCPSCWSSSRRCCAGSNGTVRLAGRPRLGRRP